MLTKIFAISRHSTFEFVLKFRKKFKIEALWCTRAQWGHNQSVRGACAILTDDAVCLCYACALMTHFYAHWWWRSLCVVNICTYAGGTWAMQTNDCFSIFFYLEYSDGVRLFEDIYVLSLRKVCHIFWLIWSTKSRWMFFQTTFL